MIDQYEKNGLRVTITYEEYPFSPREDDMNLGTILYTSNRYILGDEQVSRERIQEIIEDDNYFYLPVYAYIHGGVALSTGPFSCPWDSGQCGIIYCSKQELKNGSITIESATKIFKEEIEQFNKYLNGEVYRFVIHRAIKCDECSHNKWETVDSCGGYYDMDYMKEEIEAILKSEMATNNG